MHGKKTLLLGAAVVALLVPAGCSPAQWNFVFSVDVPDPEDLNPALREFIVPVGGLTGGFTDSRDFDTQDGLRDESEVSLTSLTFWITGTLTEADFSSVDSIDVFIELQSPPGGTRERIAYLPSGDPQLSTDRVDLNTTDVDLAAFLEAPYTITIELTGTGPTAELRFAGQAVFSGSSAL